MAASARSTANLAANVLAHTGNAGRQMIGAMTGVVVSAGKMDKTVKVRLWGQRWEKHVQKVSSTSPVRPSPRLAPSVGSFCCCCRLPPPRGSSARMCGRATT